MVKKEKIRDEHTEQVRFMAVLRNFYRDILVFAVPNGGQRNPKEAKRLVDEGVLSGVSDLFIAEPYGQYHGLFIEMKRSKGGKVSDKQELFMDRAKHRGYKCVVSYGAEQALDHFQEYMQIPLQDRHYFPGTRP